MATNNPRITIMLTKRQHDVIKSISESGGQSMSSLIAQVLEVGMPIFERMAVTFQHMKRATEEQKKSMAATLHDAQNLFEPIALSAVDQFDMFMGEVEHAGRLGAHKEAAALGARAQRATRAQGPTMAPPTNRGVTPSPIKPSRASAGKALQPILKKKILKKGGGKKS